MSCCDQSSIGRMSFWLAISGNDVRRHVEKIRRRARGEHRLELRAEIVPRVDADDPHLRILAM